MMYTCIYMCIQEEVLFRANGVSVLLDPLSSRLQPSQQLLLTLPSFEEAQFLFSLTRELCVVALLNVLLFSLSLAHNNVS